MKTIHCIRFNFTAEEIAHVREVWEMLSYMDSYDFEELGEQITEEQGNSSIESGDFFDGLDALLNFMENHTDQQNK